MSISHENLNKQRSEQYRKPPEEENFLEQFNDHLVSFEQKTYRDITPSLPFIFVIGPPRSGTTLLTQLIAHCLDVGYINNLAARFWKAPVTGIKFANSVLDVEEFSAFQSHYGSTEQLADIHEFGYFWRHWLKKDAFENIKNARQMEDQIDWSGLRKTLANMQAQFNKPMVFKNIFGSYHIPKLNELLGQTLWISIERDPLDTAISILKARQKYYDDPNRWWSYVPPQYEKIIDKDYWEQIAGQIHYLKQYYRSEFENMNEPRRGLTITYEQLCEKPGKVLEQVKSQIMDLYGIDTPIAQQPPTDFEHHSYDDHAEEKSRFKKIFDRMES